MSDDRRQLEQQLLSLTQSGATVDLNTLFEAYSSIVSSQYSVIQKITLSNMETVLT